MELSKSAELALPVSSGFGLQLSMQRQMCCSLYFVFCTWKNCGSVLNQQLPVQKKWFRTSLRTEQIWKLQGQSPTGKHFETFGSDCSPPTVPSLREIWPLSCIVKDQSPDPGRFNGTAEPKQWRYFASMSWLCPSSGNYCHLSKFLPPFSLPFSNFLPFLSKTAAEDPCWLLDTHHPLNHGYRAPLWRLKGS